LFDVLKSCARRWYVLVPLVLITTFYSYSVYSSAKPVYYSQAIIGLAPPSSRFDSAPNGEPTPRNGLLDIGGAALIANMASLSLREPAVIDQVVAGGGRPDYIARMYPTPPNTPQLPMIMIEETAPDAESAAKTLELVLAQANAAVRNPQVQAQVPQDLLVDSFVVAPPTSPAGGTPSRIRSTLAIFIGGMGLSVLAAVVLDVVLTRRRKTSAPQPDDDGSSAVTLASQTQPVGGSSETAPTSRPQHEADEPHEVNGAVHPTGAVAESK
jgi:hypothetical protein